MKLLLVAFGQTTHPIGLSDIYNFLSGKGYNIGMIHLYDDVKRINHVKEVPEYVGVTSFTHMRGKLDGVLKVIRQKWPSAKIILGGRHFVEDSLLLEQKLLDSVYKTVVGEGEYALLDILNEACSDDKLIYGKKLSKEDYMNTIMPTIDFIRTNMKNSPVPRVLFSRGCPFNCVFCCDRRIPLLRKDPEMAAWYIKQLKPIVGDSMINIIDDVFAVDKKWLELFRKSLESLGVSADFECFIHGKLFDKDMFNLLVDIGVKKFNLGAESGDNDVLKLLNKQTTVEDYIKINEMMSKSDVKLHCMWMIGNIGETEHTINKTIKLSRKIGTNKWWFSFAVPFPGTDFWKKAPEYGKILTYDFSKWYNSSLVYVPHGLTVKKLLHLRDVAMGE